MGLFALAAQPASAVTTSESLMLKGVNDTGNTATATISYDDEINKLTIDILNTAAGDDPRITAFGFNSPDDVTLSGFSSSLMGWSYATDQNTPGQFGIFADAGITGPNFNGGSPNDGIEQGDTATFMFDVGGNLAGLTAASFLNLSADEPGMGTDPQVFIVRFQRTTGPCDDSDDNNCGSDVGIPMEVVPVPASLPLLFTAMLGLGFLGRRRVS